MQRVRNGQMGNHNTVQARGEALRQQKDTVRSRWRICVQPCVRGHPLIPMRYAFERLIDLYPMSISEGRHMAKLVSYGSSLLIAV